MDRDGLALRAMGWLMRRGRADHRLLIILSDASPNDDQRIPIGALPLGGYVYSGKRGIEDTAAEAGILRRQGITPVCVFTGSDLELEGGRKIYGKALTRIPTIGWFCRRGQQADTGTDTTVIGNKRGNACVFPSCPL